MMLHSRPSRSAAIAPHQAAVAVDHGDDAHAVRAHVERLAVPSARRSVARAGPAAEALGLVVADDGAVVLLDDDAVAGLLDDRALAAVLGALLPRPSASRRSAWARDLAVRCGATRLGPLPGADLAAGGAPWAAPPGGGRALGRLAERCPVARGPRWAPGRRRGPGPPGRGDALLARRAFSAGRRAVTADPRPVGAAPCWPGVPLGGWRRIAWAAAAAVLLRVGGSFFRQAALGRQALLRRRWWRCLRTAAAALPCWRRRRWRCLRRRRWRRRLGRRRRRFRWRRWRRRCLWRRLLGASASLLPFPSSSFPPALSLAVWMKPSGSATTVAAIALSATRRAALRRDAGDRLIMLMRPNCLQTRTGSCRMRAQCQLRALYCSQGQWWYFAAAARRLFALSARQRTMLPRGTEDTDMNKR